MFAISNQSAAGKNLKFKLAPPWGELPPLVNSPAIDSEFSGQRRNPAEMLDCFVSSHADESRTLDAPPSSTLDARSSRICDMTIKERIAEARKVRGMSKRGLDRAMGLPHGTTWSWEEGSSGGPNRRNLLLCARALGVEPLWLEFGEGPMQREERLSPDARELAEFIDSLPERQRQAARETLGLLGEHRTDDPSSNAS